MAKSKNTIALYEVISSSSQSDGDSTKIPPWWKADALPEAPQPDRPIIQRGPESEKSTVSPNASESRAQTVIRMEDGRIVVAAPPFIWAICGFGLAAALLAAFYLGGRVGSRGGDTSVAGFDAAEPPQSTAIETTTDSVIGAMLDNVEENAGAVRSSRDRGDWLTLADLEPGRTYLVMQQFLKEYPEHEAAAKRAREFLSARGEGSNLIKDFPVKGDWSLFGVRSFDYKKESDAFWIYQKSVHKIGKAYHASGGGYEFDGYAKTARVSAKKKSKTR
jgi:hypothetical protein